MKELIIYGLPTLITGFALGVWWAKRAFVKAFTNVAVRSTPKEREVILSFIEIAKKKL